MHPRHDPPLPVASAAIKWPTPEDFLMQAQPARREFVKTAAAAIATSQFPILGANDRVNVGIVGLGGRGNDHIGFYSTLDSDCRIAALCDVNQAAREKAVARVLKAKNYSPKEFADMREV